MKQNNRPLTAEEKSFAEKALNIVYSFLHDFGFDINEYFDIVIFGYLHAVRLYHEREDLRQYSFGTIAYRQMRAALYRNQQKNNALGRKCELPEIRLDEKFQESDSEKHEVYSNVQDFADDLITQLYWERILCKLKPEEKKLVEQLVDGKSMSDIAEMENVSRQAVHQRVCKIRQRLKPDKKRKEDV